MQDKRDKTLFRSSLIGVFLNFLLFLLKLLAGLISKSISIISDAVNNLTDSFSSFVSFLGFKYANKKPDKEHPYGHKRVEYITGLIIGIIIVFVALNLFLESIKTMIDQPIINVSLVTLILLSISLLTKILLGLYYYISYKKTNSIALKGNSLDCFTDSLATILILIGSILVKFYYIPFSLDGLLGILVSILVFLSGFTIIKESFNPLISETPDQEALDTVYVLINRYKKIIKGTHDLKYHAYGKGKIFIAIHCEIDYKTDIMLAHEIIDKIERDALKKHNIDLTIHLDPINYDDELTNTLKNLVDIFLSNISKEILMHDFRVVKSSEYYNLIFDLILPVNLNMSWDNLESGLKEYLLKHKFNVNLLISYDQIYF